MTNREPEYDLLDLATPYAMDAVSATERDAIEERLHGADVRTQRGFSTTVRDVRETLAAMTIVDAVPAPSSVEARIMRAIDEQLGTGERIRPDSRGEPSAASVHSITSARGGRRGAGASAGRANIGKRRLAWAAAAAAVVIAVGGGIAAVVNERSNDPQQQITAQVVMNQPDSHVHTVDVTGGGRLQLATSAGLGAAAVSFDAMAQPPADRSYQLWFVPTGGQPRSAGVLAALPASGSMVFQDYDARDTFAITVEPRGGSQQPTSDPIAAVPMN